MDVSRPMPRRDRDVRDGWDAVVVGAGPGGSIAALVLARAGARVALVDRSEFPRDKACGDLIGPRGVQILQELGVRVPEFGRGSDMVIVGPSGGRARLPAFPGRTYADHGVIVPRRVLDDVLRTEAIAAGATPITARIVAADRSADGSLDILTSSDGMRLRGRVVIGADGALSPIAHVAGMLDREAALWGFAIRGYVAAHVPLPLLALLDRKPGRIFPGYGWLFPGADGRANIGIGLALKRRSRPAAGLHEDLVGLSERLRASGDLPARSMPGPVIGGWLRMGGIGSPVAAHNVLLVGDAAGLVNPLQGEGIAPAMVSGRLAAEAVVAEAASAHPASAGEAYAAALDERFGSFIGGAAAVHTAMLRRTRLTSASARLCTSPGLRRVVAGTWSLYMNGLVDGAQPRPAAWSASLLQRTTARMAADRAPSRGQGPTLEGRPCDDRSEVR
jgi:geranylgeranyl reductase family protein